MKTLEQQIIYFGKAYQLASKANGAGCKTTGEFQMKKSDSSMSISSQEQSEDTANASESEAKSPVVVVAERKSAFSAFKTVSKPLVVSPAKVQIESNNTIKLPRITQIPPAQMLMKFNGTVYLMPKQKVAQEFGIKIADIFSPFK